MARETEERSLWTRSRLKYAAGPPACLELCEKENLGGAPYVRFNGEEIMAQATNEKVLARIEELVGGAA